MKALVELALKNSGSADRYRRRMMSNPILAKLGCLPQNMTEISNHEPPWFCHGLAVRMAAYSNASSDALFARWETLLRLAQSAEGWQNEYAHWDNDADHWAKKWDKFHQFLWLLQCYEYFSQPGVKVSFPASNNKAMPDLLIEQQGQDAIYAECFFYSKWWPREFHLKELLRFIDPNLSIRRTHNIKHDASRNPFFSDDQFINALDQIETVLTPDALADLRAAALQASPQKVCEIGDIKILLEGTGEYRPNSNNAQGDPAYSWPVYVKEVIAAKKNSNNLNGSRPNIVMVNGLGLDFQFSHGTEPPPEVLPSSIDEMWIAVCGIDGKLEACRKVEKILREGYAGSGFASPSLSEAGGGGRRPEGVLPRESR